MFTREQLESLAAAAVAAPSADNRHMFRLHAGDGLDLRATDEFVEANPTRRILGWLSMGAATENLVLRAAALGLRFEPVWHPATDDERLVVRFPWRAASRTEDPLERAIHVRQTNRRLRFGGSPLSPSQLDRLAAEADVLPGTHVLRLDAPQRRRRALQLVRAAEAERFRNEELHRELFDSIRFDAGWRATTVEGLPPGSLCLHPFERGAFTLLRRWAFQRVANRVGVHRFIALRGADLPCRTAPHLCAITAEGDLPCAAWKAGRLLQRVWLHASHLGLSVQVFAAPALYALEECTAVGSELRQRLQAGWQDLGARGRPFMLLRMGRAAPPPVRAGRPDAGDLLVTAAP